MTGLELRVENLNVGFGRRTVLRGISFTVHSGEFICLLGQNAAGKTTLFKAVSNLIASSGRVTLCENGKALPQSAIAYLPQLTQVQSRLTVFEMVMLGLGRRLSWRVTPDIFERVDQTLHAMQISHLPTVPWPRFRAVKSSSSLWRRPLFPVPACCCSMNLLLRST